MTRSLRSTVITFTLISIVACALITGLRFHPYFSLQSVTVTGNNFVSSQDIEIYQQNWHRQSAPWIWAVPAYQHHLLTDFPIFKSVQLTYHFPNSLTLKITEKAPWSVFWNQGTSVIVAEDGTILNRADDSVLSNLNNIVIIRDYPLPDRMGYQLPQQVIDSIGDTISIIRRYRPNQTITLEWNSPNWTLFHDDGIPIYLGSLDHAATQFNLLDSFYRWLPEQPTPKPVRYIDLRISDQLIVAYGQ